MLKFKDITKNNTKIKMPVLILSATEKISKSNSFYLTLALSDGSQAINAILWENTEGEFKYDKGQLATVTIEKQDYRGKESYHCFSVEAPPAGLTTEMFAMHAPYTGELLYERILKRLDKSCNNKEVGSLYSLTINLYEQNKEKLLHHSAAKSVHHAYCGGLLYHTARMVSAADNMAHVYPSLDKDLLLCAAALHDIGKLEELDTDLIGTTDYTIDGTLMGHLYLGTEMIDREVLMTPVYDEEQIRCLKHCILSHHGKKEYGAVAEPAIPEALVLHEIDMIDSRMEMFESMYANIEAGTVSEMPTYGKIYKAKNKA